MSKHTPGPWHAIHNPRWPGAKVRIDNNPSAPWANFGAIAHVHKSDANLIAAAPEMLAVLDYAMTALQTLANTLGGISEEHAEEIIQDAADKIGEAIAKAKGE